MKKIERIFSLILALMVVFAVTITTDAATITINETQSGETYKFYKIFDVVVDDDGNYTYTITDKEDDGEYVNAWYEVVSSEKGKSYFILTELLTDNNVTTYVVNVVSGVSGEDIAEFLASYTSEFDKDNEDTINETKSIDADGDSITYENADNGYYLITSSLGTLLVADTTYDDETEEYELVIDSKNEIPTITKKITNSCNDNDSDGLADATSASIGDEIEFKVTIAARTGAVNYVVTDTLSSGLTSNVELETDDDGTVTGVENLVIKALGGELTYGGDYIVTIDGQKMTITFTQSYLDSITEYIKGTSGVESVEIVITYSATVNSNAEIGAEKSDTDLLTDGSCGDYAGKNTNSVVLSYGSSSKTAEDIVYVSVFGFEINKTDEEGSELDATFELNDSGTSDASGFTFSVSGTTYTYDKDESMSSISAGYVTIEGLAAGTYYLNETKAPSGYNKLSDAITVIIEYDGSITINGANGYGSESGGVITVINTSGSELPSTGGVGTTVLYILGGVLILCAGVVLVARRRMNA